MAGKAPLLLAMVLFAIGVSGLALSSAERARWGPFEPGSTPATQQVRVTDSGTPYTVPGLDELFTSRVETAVADVPAPESVATTSAAPTAAPMLPPLRVYGISGDDAGVSAAAVQPTPPPVTVIDVATDADPTATPENAEEGTERIEPGPESYPPPGHRPQDPAPQEPLATQTPSPNHN